MWRAFYGLFVGVTVLLQATAGATQGVAETPALEGRAAARNAQKARDSYRERINENVLFLMGGQLGATYSQIAQDIAVVVDEGINLRVLPVIGGAGVQNVHDVVFLRGIDLALTNVQTLNQLRKTGEFGPNLDRQVAYIAALFPEEMQILVRGNINSVDDLSRKRVNFNNKGSATALFAPLVFKALGIEVQPVFMSQPDAVQKMRSGEVEATICICPKPVPAYASIQAGSGFKFIEVPYVQDLRGDYLPAVITTDDYPNIVPQKDKIETIAGSTVLITFNWPRGSVRYSRTAKFVDAFFSKFGDLQKPPRHPLWRSVNYAANLAGWSRFPAAQEWLERTNAVQSASVEASFAEFLNQKRAQGAQPDLQDPEEKERLFREFLEASKKTRN